MGRLILITNDDGIDAGGIRQLAETAKAFGEVGVVAPESQRSGKSHSVTYLEPLYVRERPGYMDGVKAYECSGVPVDCVRVGIHLLGRKPDVVLSGINSGYNISGDIQYSGTAGAALEAAFWGIHAIALSQANLDYHPVTDRYLRALIGEYMDKPLPQNTVWNINFPGCAPEDCKGVKRGCAVSQDDFYKDGFNCKTLGDGALCRQKLARQRRHRPWRSVRQLRRRRHRDECAIIKTYRFCTCSLKSQKQVLFYF